LIDRWGWPSIYWVSGSLALFGLLLVWLLVPGFAPSSKPLPFDFRGTLFLFLTVGGLLIAPPLAGSFGIDSWATLSAAGIGLCAMGLLWWNCNRRDHPVIEVSLLRKPAFVLPCSIYLLH